MKRYVEVAVELPLEGTFTYEAPAGFGEDLRLGARVLVPFGKRTVTGYVVGASSGPPVGVKSVKEVADLLDEGPLFDERMLKFYKWVSAYYFAPLGEVLSLISPASSNIKSIRRLCLTEEGRKRQVEKTGPEAALLEAAAKGASWTALSRLKIKGILGLIRQLKKEGLIIEETKLEGGAGPKYENHLSIIEGKPQEEALKDLARSPIQTKLYRYLIEKRSAPISVVRKDLGEAGQAAKRLSEKGLIGIKEVEVKRDPFADIAPKAGLFEPNEEQRAAIEAITGALRSGAFSPFLLYGVTGSGKTLVYLKALQEAVRLGKKAIVLCPEIALTPWPAAYLSAIFPGRVALAHSGLSDAERMDEWRRILRNEADIIVGARSAIFSPIKDLGLIIVDEEHETSYKQDDGVRYHARDVALMLGKHIGITVVLGSATPSVETFHNAKTGKLNLLTMRKRAAKSTLPDVEIADVKGGKDGALCERLKWLMAGALEDGAQVLLFLNRRGFSNSIVCKDCGHSFSCLNCSVTLTVHKAARALKCHYCDFSIPLPGVCPKCNGTGLIQPGTGTERVEEEVRWLFPRARAGRMDRDTTKKRGSVKKILDAVEGRKLDILIGTQMVSKGHHFPGITLVGIISGDTSLNIPDFRSSERTFQLITQAAGRAGRADEPGRVVIQTLNPEHYCLKTAIGHDYDAFFEEEMQVRRETFYPPFSRLTLLRVEGTSEEKVIGSAMGLKAHAERLLKSKDHGVAVLGPAPALISKLKGRHRWQILLKAKDARSLHAFTAALKNAFDARKNQGTTLIIDVDPL